MKKIVSLLLSACLLSCLLVACSGDEKGSEEKGTPLTLENYEQYLKIHTYDTDAGFRFDVNPVTTNYDFNDVELVVKATGTYDTYSLSFIRYSSPGVPLYSRNIKKSGVSFNKTATLKLNVGGTIMDGNKEIIFSETNNVDMKDINVEVVKISGSVSK